jgi:hypothetical protein
MTQWFASTSEIRVLGLVQRALTAEFGLGMLRCVGDTEVAHLPIADSGDMPGPRPAARVGRSGIDQSERAVADAADDLVGRVGFGDLGG